MNLYEIKRLESNSKVLIVIQFGKDTMEYHV